MLSQRTAHTQCVQLGEFGHINTHDTIPTITVIDTSQFSCVPFFVVVVFGFWFVVRTLSMSTPLLANSEVHITILLTIGPVLYRRYLKLTHPA